MQLYLGSLDFFCKLLSINYSPARAIDLTTNELTLYIKALNYTFGLTEITALLLLEIRHAKDA